LPESWNEWLLPPGFIICSTLLMPVVYFMIHFNFLSWFSLFHENDDIWVLYTSFMNHFHFVIISWRKFLHEPNSCTLRYHVNFLSCFTFMKKYFAQVLFHESDSGKARSFLLFLRILVSALLFAVWILLNKSFYWFWFGYCFN